MSVRKGSSNLSHGAPRQAIAIPHAAPREKIVTPKVDTPAKPEVIEPEAPKKSKKSMKKG